MNEGASIRSWIPSGAFLRLDNEHRIFHHRGESFGQTDLVRMLGLVKELRLYAQEVGHNIKDHLPESR